MKYMLIMRATDESDAAFADGDFDMDTMMSTIGAFNDELVRAGVLLATEGLDPDPASGVVVDFTGEAPAVSCWRDSAVVPALAASSFAPPACAPPNPT